MAALPSETDNNRPYMRLVSVPRFFPGKINSHIYFSMLINKLNNLLVPSGSISETKKGIWKQNFLLFSYEKDYECYWHNESQPSTTDDKYLSFFFVTGFTIFGTLKSNQNCFMRMLKRMRKQEGKKGRGENIKREWREKKNENRREEWHSV